MYYNDMLDPPVCSLETEVVFSIVSPHFTAQVATHGNIDVAVRSRYPRCYPRLLVYRLIGNGCGSSSCHFCIPGVRTNALNVAVTIPRPQKDEDAPPPAYRLEVLGACFNSDSFFWLLIKAIRYSP